MGGCQSGVSSLPVTGYYGRDARSQKGGPRSLEAGVQFGGPTTDLSQSSWHYSDGL